MRQKKMFENPYSSYSSFPGIYVADFGKVDLVKRYI